MWNAASRIVVYPLTSALAYKSRSPSRRPRPEVPKKRKRAGLGEKEVEVGYAQPGLIDEARLAYAKWGSLGPHVLVIGAKGAEL